MLISVLLIAIAGVVYFILLGQWHTTAFAAGRTNTVKVYSYGAEAAADTDKSPGLTECGEVIRGSEVTRYSQSVTEGGVTYHKVKVKAYADGTEPGGEDLYMPEESTAKTIGKTVLETETFVRTPATI